MAVLGNAAIATLRPPVSATLPPPSSITPAVARIPGTTRHRLTTIAGALATPSIVAALSGVRELLSDQEVPVSRRQLEWLTGITAGLTVIGNAPINELHHGWQWWFVSAVVAVLVAVLTGRLAGIQGFRRGEDLERRIGTRSPVDIDHQSWQDGPQTAATSAIEEDPLSTVPAERAVEPRQQVEHISAPKASRPGGTVAGAVVYAGPEADLTPRKFITNEDWPWLISGGALWAVLSILAMWRGGFESAVTFSALTAAASVALVLWLAASERQMPLPDSAFLAVVLIMDSVLYFFGCALPEGREKDYGTLSLTLSAFLIYLMVMIGLIENIVSRPFARVPLTDQELINADPLYGILRRTLWFGDPPQGQLVERLADRLPSARIVNVEQQWRNREVRRESAVACGRNVAIVYRLLWPGGHYRFAGAIPNGVLRDDYFNTDCQADLDAIDRDGRHYAGELFDVAEVFPVVVVGNNVTMDRTVTTDSWPSDHLACRNIVKETEVADFITWNLREAAHQVDIKTMRRLLKLAGHLNWREEIAHAESNFRAIHNSRRAARRRRPTRR